MTDAEGFANLGPFTPGEAIAVEIVHDGFDNVKQDITADENQKSVTLKLGDFTPKFSICLLNSRGAHWARNDVICSEKVIREVD